MIPYEIDPSLHTAEPREVMLDDGFSPPRHGEPAMPEKPPHADAEVPAATQAKLCRTMFMSTHPVEPEPLPPGREPPVPNPSHLPVEPEFGPVPTPVEPEDPRGKPPNL